MNQGRIEESCSNGKKNWKNARKKILASMRMGKGKTWPKHWKVRRSG